MQGKDTTISTFNQLFGPVSSEKFRQQVKITGVDKYAKKLHAMQLIELIAHAQIKQHRGLRDMKLSSPQPSLLTKPRWMPWWLRKKAL